MNRSQKRILKLTSGIIGLSFALITASVGTVAWFMANSRTHVDGIDIETVSSGLTLRSAELYKYDFDESKGVRSTSLSDFSLPGYDALFIESDNKHANAIIRLEFEFSSFSTPIDQLELEVSCGNTPFYFETGTDAGKIAKYSSNVIQFKNISSSLTSLNGGSNTTTSLSNVENINSYLANLDPIQDAELIASIREAGNLGPTDPLEFNSGLNEDLREIDFISDAIYKQATLSFNKNDTPTAFIDNTKKDYEGNTYSAKTNEQNEEEDTVLYLNPFFSNSTKTLKGAVVYLECSYDISLITDYYNEYKEKSLSELKALFNLGGDIDKITISQKNSDTVRQSGRYVEVTDENNFVDGKYLTVSKTTTNKNKSFDGSSSSLGSSRDVVVKTETEESFNRSEIKSDPYTNGSALSLDSSTNHLLTAKERAENDFITDNDSKVIYNNKTSGTSQLALCDADEAEGTIYENNFKLNRNKGTSTYRSNAGNFEFNDSNNSYNYVTKDASIATFSTTTFKYEKNADVYGKLVNLEITKEPTLKEYIVGVHTSIDLTGIEADLIYENGGRVKVNPSILKHKPVSLECETIETKTVTVYCEENGIEYKDTYEITVANSAPKTITVITNPKTSYYAGDALDLTGMVVNVELYNGDSYTYTTPADFSANLVVTPSHGTTLSAEDTTVSIQFVGFTKSSDPKASFNITVQNIKILLNGSTSSKISNKYQGEAVQISYEVNVAVSLTVSCSMSDYSNDYTISQTNIGAGPNPSTPNTGVLIFISTAKADVTFTISAILDNVVRATVQVVCHPFDCFSYNASELLCPLCSSSYSGPVTEMEDDRNFFISFGSENGYIGCNGKNGNPSNMNNALYDYLENVINGYNYYFGTGCLSKVHNISNILLTFNNNQALHTSSKLLILYSQKSNSNYSVIKTMDIDCDASAENKINITFDSPLTGFFSFVIAKNDNNGSEQAFNVRNLEVYFNKIDYSSISIVGSLVNHEQYIGSLFNPDGLTVIGSTATGFNVIVPPEDILWNLGEPLAVDDTEIFASLLENDDIYTTFNDFTLVEDTRLSKSVDFYNVISDSSSDEIELNNLSDNYFDKWLSPIKLKFYKGSAPYNPWIDYNFSFGNADLYSGSYFVLQTTSSFTITKIEINYSWNYGSITSNKGTYAEHRTDGESSQGVWSGNSNSVQFNYTASDNYYDVGIGSIEIYYCGV